MATPDDNKGKKGRKLAAWNPARLLLQAVRGNSRNRIAARIMLGKELLERKKALGCVGPGRPKINSAASDRINSAPKWREHCNQQLGIAGRTADRYIANFETAVQMAKFQVEKLENEAMEPICRLFATPSAELVGDEWEQLVDVAEDLVDCHTNRALLIEWGVITEEEDDGGKPDPAAKQDQSFFDFFTPVVSQTCDLIRQIQRVPGLRDYRKALDQLPLDSEDPNSPSLERIRAQFAELRDNHLAGLLADLEEAIELKRKAEIPRLGE